MILYPYTLSIGTLAIDFDPLLVGAIGVASALGAAAAKALSSEAAKAGLHAGKSKLFHMLKTDVCPGSEALKESGAALKSIADMKTVMDMILAQLKPNGGSSLKDAVNRLENAVSAVQSEVRHIRTSAELASDAAGALLWRADRAGRIIWVSKAIKESLGEVNDTSFMGWSWLNLIHHEDRDRVRERWEEALQDQSEVVDEYRAVGKSGMIYHVVAYARPVLLNGVVDGWQGSHRILRVENQK